MNECSYNFSLFGEPSTTAPWGWQMHGHHLALNCLVIGKQIVISPTFMGAEPNIIDEGPHAGLTIFNEEERSGLALMRSLPPMHCATARRSTRACTIRRCPPDGFIRPTSAISAARSRTTASSRTKASAAQKLTPAQRTHLLELRSAFIEYLPYGALAARIR